MAAIYTVVNSLMQLVRTCAVADEARLIELTYLYNHIYGVDLGAEMDIIRSRISKKLYEPKPDQRLVCYEEDGLIRGFCSQTFLKHPSWKIGLLFFDSALSARPEQMVQVGGQLFDNMALEAEAKGFTSMHYIVRDNGQKRFARTLKHAPHIEANYQLTAEVFIKPFEVPTDKEIAKLMGFTLGKNTKRVVIRKWAKR